MLSRQSQGEPARRHAIQRQHGWTLEALRRLLDQKQRVDQLDVSGQLQPVQKSPAVRRAVALAGKTRR